MQQFSNNNRRKQPQEQIDLLALIRYRYLSYWPLFILAAALSVGLAMVYLRYATATYKVSATLLVKEESKKLGEKDLLASLDLFGSDKNIENEMQILYSRTLATEVARNLQLYGEVFQKGKVHDLLAYENAPLQFRFLEPEKIKPGKPEMVPFVYNAANASVSLYNKTYRLNDTVASPWGKMLIKAQPGVAPDDKTYYLQITDEKQLTQVLLSRLAVSPVSKMGTVIKLEYSDVAPARGEDILNELIRVYNAAAIEDKNRVAASTMSFVDDRLRIVSQELNQVEGKVESFKKREGIVDIGEQSKLFLESVQENDSKMSEANMQLSVLESIEKYVSGKGEGENIVPATLGLSDPVLMELVAKLYETDMERERLKKTTGENSPVIGALNRQIAKLTPSIMENINSLRNNLNAGKERLEASNNRFTSILRSVPGKERALVEVSREREIKNNIYTFLLQKREETALAYAAAISDSRIVDAAEASSIPFSPKKTTVLAMAIIAGIVVVAAVITIKDMMNREIVERAEIEKATAAPIVAEIMYDDNKESIVIADGKRSLVAEQFRSLRTSLSYIGLNGDNKTLLITSSISGEGKSFVSINLAASISLIRKKVVLLEFDLRKPMISKMLGIEREPGITNYLVGRGNLSDMLRPVPGNDFLFVLPAGVIPPNPTELILNGRLEEMLTHLKTMFDYVIIDTAPVGIVTDARLLAPFADACLYVLRQQVTPKLHLKLIDELYRNKEVGKLNLVFNGVRPRGVSAQGYGYGYGYVDEPKKNGKRKRFIKNIFNI
ncbi:polysaccharide biosynthesis tyrosine autokinase [Chitinophaga sp. SYP-B3965]|uniref:GumC family protein n=1 Tax=Chitinophaga sp. SYP-B3965 TaxID=2663120 RepID=UPI001299A983|nr:polysaccharide biosynthesis tyrosine autokinase [Chitinophaga sp. SYP-B3965]MRG43866.1 polysaccharide biosynthesis tyrosine autokinase [Chitinophaga sp. SYP-B3965]